MKKLVALAFACFAGTALAQGLEPGEWEFSTTVTSATLPRPQSGAFRQCIRKEDAANPERWMGQGGGPSECTFTPTQNTANALAWQMRCPKSNMSGTGSARIGRGTMESQMQMSGEIQGQRFELTTRMSGRRLGPCKS